MGFFSLWKKAAQYFRAAIISPVLPRSELCRTGLLVCLTLSVFRAFPVVAAPVVEIGAPQNHRSGVQAGDMFYQIQVLQEEVRQLRGILEEQSYQLRLLKERQAENYLDLDGRLAAITAPMGTTPTGAMPQTKTGGQSKPQVEMQAPAPGVPTRQSAGVSTSGSNDGAEVKYNAAYGLLKARKLDDSLAAFQNFVVAYPASSYTPNAYYWMGEIHLVRNHYDEAAVEFRRVIENYPVHRKAPDARYKLGTVYYQMGDKGKAREYLQAAAEAGGSSARLAQRYLDANF